MRTLAHAVHGQKTQKHKVNERYQQLFAQRHRLLVGHPTDQIGTTMAPPRGHASEPVRCQAHIGIHKYKQRIRGVLGERGTGVLLATPTRG
jgi:hypothetical protein